MPPFTEDERARELTRLMRAYGDSVKRLCRAYLGQRDAAEDAAQETFIRAYEHIDKLLSGEIVSEKAWLAGGAPARQAQKHRGDALGRAARRRRPLRADAGRDAPARQIPRADSAPLLSGFEPARLREYLGHIRGDRVQKIGESAGNAARFAGKGMSR